MKGEVPALHEDLREAIAHRDDPTPQAELTSDSIRTARPVPFAFDGSIILYDFFSLLDDVAEILIRGPDLCISIEGHTDDVGDAAYNQRLSEDRARAVRAYLIDRGIDAARLVAAGFGKALPIDDNTTDIGRTRNRRAEFRIVK